MDISSAKQKQTAIRVIFFTVFLDILGFGIVIPQLGVYSSKFGAEGWVIGLLGASYSIMQFLFAPFWGALSDRIGRRPVLIWSIFGTAWGYVIFAFAHSIPLLFVSRILDGITGANISAAQAYISDISEPKERAKMFGLFGAVFGLGFVLGPACGLLLSQLPGNWGGNLGVGLFTAALGFFNWLFALKFLPETVTAEMRAANKERQAARRLTTTSRLPLDVRAFTTAFRMPGLNLMLVIAFVATFAFANLQVTYTPFLIVKYVRPAVQEEIRTNTAQAVEEARHHLSASTPAVSMSKEAPGFSPSMGGDFSLDRAPPEGMSWRQIESTLVSQRAVRYANSIFVTIGIAAVLVQGLLIPFLKKRFNEVSLLFSGTIIMALGLTLVPFSSTYAGQFPISILIALGNGLFMPILSALVSEHSPESERGEIFGVFQSMQSLGRMIGPILGGLLFQFVAHPAPYISGGLIMLIAIYLATRLRTFCRLHRPDPDAPELVPEPAMES